MKATVSVPTSVVSSAQTVTLTAQLGQSSFQTTVAVNPSSLLEAYASPSAVTGGLKTNAVVQLSGPAGTGGNVISITGGDSNIAYPSSVTVPAGATGVSFGITTSQVKVSTAETLTATQGSQTRLISFTLSPNSISKFYTAATSLIGPGSVSAVVQLLAPPGGTGDVVGISGGDASISYASSVTVPGTTTGVSFTIKAVAVSAPVNETLSASYGGVSRQTTITLNPEPLRNFYTSPTSVAGGNSCSGVIQLLGAAGPNDVVALSGGDSSISYPPTVTVPSGATGLSFSFSTSQVTASKTETLSATFNGVTKSATLTLTANVLRSFYLNPTGSIVGGNSVEGVVQLLAPAPTGGDVVSLTSNNSHAVVPATVTVPAGKTGVSFTITTSAPSQAALVTLTATFGGGSKQITVTVEP